MSSSYGTAEKVRDLVDLYNQQGRRMLTEAEYLRTLGLVDTRPDGPSDRELTNTEREIHERYLRINLALHAEVYLYESIVAPINFMQISRQGDYPDRRASHLVGF